MTSAAEVVGQVAKLRRDLQATNQALLEARAELVNRAVRDEAAVAYCAAWLDGASSYELVTGTRNALMDAYLATTPSETPSSHVIVSRAELERLRKADTYLQEYLNGYLDMGDLEDVRMTGAGAS